MTENVLFHTEYKKCKADGEMEHLLNVRVVEENPDFHLGVEKKGRVVVSVVADQSHQVKLCRDSPVRFHQRIEHLNNMQRHTLHVSTSSRPRKTALSVTLHIH